MFFFFRINVKYLKNYHLDCCGIPFQYILHPVSTSILINYTKKKNVSIFDVSKFVKKKILQLPLHHSCANTFMLILLHKLHKKTSIINVLSFLFTC